MRLSSKLERDLSWEKYDTAHCPSNKCPSLTVKLLVPGDFEYEPCFNIPEGEAVCHFVISKPQYMDAA